MSKNSNATAIPKSVKHLFWMQEFNCFRTNHVGDLDTKIIDVYKGVSTSKGAGMKFKAGLDFKLERFQFQILQFPKYFLLRDDLVLANFMLSGLRMMVKATYAEWEQNSL